VFYLFTYKILPYSFYKNHLCTPSFLPFLLKPTLLTIHVREHRAEVVKHPPFQHFLYKFSDFVNDRPHELREQARKLWNHRLRHNYNTACLPSVA
jgi:hypothetical protein